MHCKLCNTRISLGEKACPNCGADVRGMSGSHPAPRRSSRLSPPGLSASGGGRGEPELELDAVTGSGAPAAPHPHPPQAPAAAATRPPPGAMGPASLRALLAERPELLEPGLRVYRDESGATVGVDYATGVGTIDLLASDGRGHLVAVMVAEKARGEEDLVADALQRLGWLRKHLCKPGQPVRALVLVEEPPAGLSYAAAAVSDTVAFKTYRVALIFEDVEV
jgi:hypothetical protein